MKAPRPLRNRRADRDLGGNASLHGSGSHLLVQREAQIWIRIDRRIEDADFVVQVRAGAAAALSYIAYRVAPADVLSGSHGKAREMAVQRADAVAMVDQHRAAVAVHEIGEADNPVRRSDDAGAVIAGDIHAAMERSLAAEWINAL